MIINMSGAKAPEPEEPDYQEKTTQASSFPVVVTADVGYDALSKVTVTAPANLSAGNIKSGVNIAGVTGSYAPSTQTKVTTPTSFPTVVNVDSGYDGMTKVTVNSPSNLTAGNIKSGVSIAGITGTYTGESPTAQSKAYTPSTFPVTVYPDSSYNYLNSVTINKPSSLVASSIAPGKTICGISGTWEPNLQDRTVTPNKFPYTVEKTSSSYNGLGTVTVSKPTNLTADNIAKGVSIAGITGTYEGNAPSLTEKSLSYWPCFGTSVTSTGTAKTDSVVRLSGNRKGYLFGTTGQCEVSVPAMGAEVMGLGSGWYNASLTSSTTNQTATLNTGATSLCSAIDSMVGTTSWTASCIGIFAGYQESMYLYCRQAPTNTSAIITKSGSTVRIKAGAAYTIGCDCNSATVRLGFYPMHMYVYT